jgi:hypothetical protein
MCFQIDSRTELQTSVQQNSNNGRNTSEKKMKKRNQRWRSKKMVLPPVEIPPFQIDSMIGHCHAPINNKG